mgnify:CR=1 FL=1
MILHVMFIALLPAERLAMSSNISISFGAGGSYDPLSKDKPTIFQNETYYTTTPPANVTGSSSESTTHDHKGPHAEKSNTARNVHTLLTVSLS